MTYRMNVFKFLYSEEDHLYRIKKAEQIQLWKANSFLLLAAALIYGWAAFLGIGSETLSGGLVSLPASDHLAEQLWFMVGRIVYGLLFAAFILFFPSLLYYLLTGIPYKKLVLMQQVALAVLLAERLLWIPLAVFTGLDWDVSPISFGIIASYITEAPWAIAFFGSISLFQIWIIAFHAKYLMNLSDTRKHVVWINVILLHLLGWLLAALIVFADSYIIGGWFG